MANRDSSGYDPFGLRRWLCRDKCWVCDKGESKLTDRKWIQCGECDLWAHMKCVKLDGVSEEKLRDFRYCCTICAKELKMYKAGHKSECVKETLGLMNNISSMIEDMRKEVLAKIEVSKESVTEKIVSVAAESSDSYADMVKRGKNSGAKNLVIVEPANENISLDDMQTLVAEVIGGGDVVPTDTRFKKKKIIMNFQKEEGKRVIADKVKEVRNVTVKERTRRLKPNITICNVVNQEPKEDLADVIVRRNSYLQNVTDVRSKIVFKFKKKAHGGTEHYVYRVDPEVRKLIHEHGDKISLTWSNYKIYDRYLPLICFYCQGYGHTEENCFKKKNKENPVCRLCSGGHRSSACEVEEGDFKCVHCTRRRGEDDDECDTNHVVGSGRCMVHNKEIDRIREDTDHGY